MTTTVALLQSDGYAANTIWRLPASLGHPEEEMAARVGDRPLGGESGAFYGHRRAEQEAAESGSVSATGSAAGLARPRDLAPGSRKEATIGGGGTGQINPIRFLVADDG